MTPRCIIQIKGGGQMGYSVKWVENNLGVTRDMLRYYEKQKLLPSNKNRNYRDYSDEDIERIWSIKLLIGIGFSTKEIYEFMNNPEFNFDDAMANKVVELERKHDENVLYLEFAKSIKFMGRIPTVSKIGSIPFNEFLAYAHENWNFYKNPQDASFMKFADTLISKKPQEWSINDVEHISEMIEQFENKMHIYTLHGYYQVISDMQELGYDSDTVQRVVRLLHKYLVEHNTEAELEGKITPQVMAKYIAPCFFCGDVGIQNEQNYGKEGCLFIAQALAYYGGYNIEDL